MYTTFPGVQGYKIWESFFDHDYGYPSRQPRQSNEKPKKPKHKYRVNDRILDVDNDRVGIIQKLLSWPNYLVVDSSTPTGSWICNEAHIEPLANDYDFINDIDESSPSINDYWEEEQEPALYNSLSTKITDITDTGDITILKDKVDLANDGGICVTDTVNKHDNDIEDLKCKSDINIQRVSNIECRHDDIEQKVEDLEKKQKRILKLSKLALLSRFL